MTDALNGPITQDDLDAMGGLDCESCGAPITTGRWVESRPGVAYAWCDECLMPEEDEP